MVSVTPSFIQICHNLISNREIYFSSLFLLRVNLRLSLLSAFPSNSGTGNSIRAEAAVIQAHNLFWNAFKNMRHYSKFKNTSTQLLKINHKRKMQISGQFTWLCNHIKIFLGGKWSITNEVLKLFANSTFFTGNSLLFFSDKLIPVNLRFKFFSFLSPPSFLSTQSLYKCRGCLHLSSACFCIIH